MPTTISPEREFDKVARLSVFLGLVRLGELRSRYPGIEDGELTRAAAAGAADLAASDVATASRLIDALDMQSLEEDARSMRRFLRSLLKLEQPAWIIAALRGRQALQTAMPPSASQCFSFAKLFDAKPDIDAVVWWDELVEEQRASDGQTLKDSGRAGERLTLDYETQRLASLGLDVHPKWVALDDEWLGDHVLSFDVSSEGVLTNRLIEVKACSALPLQIFLTRNEWEQALRAKDAFAIHVWHLPTEKLTELTWSDLLEHVPLDQGAGSWREARIDLRRVQAALE